MYFPYLQSVTLHTDLGDIKIELFCEQVPRACEVINAKAPITTAADDKFCDIFPDFRRNKV